MLFNIKGHRYERDIIILTVMWHHLYKISYRELQKLNRERGTSVNHTTIFKWVAKFSSVVPSSFLAAVPAEETCWKVREREIKINGETKYYYRALDKDGRILDYFISSKRSRRMVSRFFKENMAKWTKSGIFTLNPADRFLSEPNGMPEGIEISQGEYRLAP
ncbi:MAG: DDE-type integrase/transposase/recombinase [Oligoflexales bacterium]|nr:DDE-type integrase/transposase/recombinase [Oligoflexales bacterium]